MNKKKKQKITLRQVIGGSLSFLFILTLWGAVRWANYRQTFTVDAIRFSGLEILEKETVQKMITNLENHSIHDVNMGEIAQIIESNPFIKAARISRHFPNQIKINIIERKPLAMFNMESALMIDNEAVVLPNHPYAESALIPILSGFNNAKDLYPEGEQTYSVKVKEAIEILNKLSNHYPKLYDEVSELTLNKDDEYVIILADRPTKVILGKRDIIPKLNILKSFDKALGERQLTDYRLLDMRYKKQLIAREWS
jgi:cell division septal protein FtsQ